MGFPQPLSLPAAMPQGYESVFTPLLSACSAPKDSRAQNSWALRPNYLKPLQPRRVGYFGGSGKAAELVGSHSSPAGHEVEGRRGGEEYR